jgi:3-hydroxyisobutyrate dehydrogenase
MGSLMCPHLAASEEYDVLVSDMDTSRAAEIARRIGARAITAEEISSSLLGLDIVIFMLPDSTVVEDVVTNGLFDTLSPGSLIIDMGSSRPASTVALAESAASRGILYVDAPVSGGTRRATDGTLTIMVGATDEGFGAAQPLLAHLGSEVAHVGAPGAGHALKALNNLLSAIGLAAASEVLAIGTRFGLKTSTMLETLNTATGRNHATEVKFIPHVLTHQFDSGFSLKLMVKDLKLAVDLADHTGTPIPIAKTAVNQWMEAEQSLPPGADHTHFAAYVEKKADVRFE